MVKIQANRNPRRTQLNSSISNSMNTQFGIMGCIKAALTIRTYPVNSTYTNFLWIIIYCILLNVIAFALSSPIIIIKDNIKSFSLAFFTTLLTLGYTILSGFIYKKFLGQAPNHMKITYIQMMYLCMLSFIYIPLSVPIGLLIPSLGWIFYFVVGMISQYFLNINVYNIWEFTSPRTSFLFSLLTFVLQFGFIFSYMGIMLSSSTFN